MKATHTTMIHATCPLNGYIDYYEVAVETEEFIACEDIERACKFVRGEQMTQESIAESLRQNLPSYCKIRIIGRHGQNIATIVEN